MKFMPLEGSGLQAQHALLSIDIIGYSFYLCSDNRLRQSKKETDLRVVYTWRQNG